MKKWVYLFGEVAAAEKYAGSWEGVRSLLGGKGAGLFDMTRAGVPVPPGYTVTTEACNEFRKTGKFPPKMWEQALAAMTGRTITMTARVDPGIIGGVVTRIGSVVYDGSVKRHLEKMRETLTQ